MSHLTMKEKNPANVESQTPLNEEKNRINLWSTKNLLIGGLIAVLLIGTGMIFVASQKKTNENGGDGRTPPVTTKMPPVTPKMQRIFFTSDDSKKIMSVFEDGSDLKTHTNERFGEKIFSLVTVKGGSSVAFISNKTAYMMDTGSNNVTEMARVNSYNIGVSPDGETLLYIDSNNNLVAMNVKDKAVIWKKVCSISDILASNFYSPDGKSMYYVMENFDNVPKSTLYKIDAADGSNEVYIVNFGPYAGNAVISPNGKKIAFSKIINGSLKTELGVFDIETKEEPKTIYVFDGVEVKVHSWSQDLSKIILIVGRGQKNHLYVFKLDKKELKPITNDRNLISAC